MSVPVNRADPTVHGVYDYMLGGAEHRHADRELGDAITREFPSVPAHVRAAREFHLRAARRAAEQGISRFIAAGIASWKPGTRNVHDAAREAVPEAEAVYVYRGTEAHAWARVLLPRPGARSVRGAVERPGELLSAGPVAAMLAGGRPVHLALGMTLHFAPAGEAREQLAVYAGALPPGSEVALSVALADHSPRADRLLGMFTPAKVYRHTAGDVAGWLEAAGLRAEPPGVCDVRLLLRCDRWPEVPPRAPGMTAGALARKP
jgi:S-adenosyl methyltransferase